MDEHKEQKQTLGLRLRGLAAKLKPTWFDKQDVVAASGAALFVKGVAMFSHPAAFMVAGALMFLFAWHMSPPQPKQEAE